MDSELKRLLAKDAPTEADVAQAKQLAKGTMKPQILAMEERRIDANPTGSERAAIEAGEKELREALQEQDETLRPK